VLARTAAFAAFISVFLFFGLLAGGIDSLDLHGPDLPQWSYKPIGLFLAGGLISLAFAAARAAKHYVEQIRAESEEGGPRVTDAQTVKCGNPDCGAVNRIRCYSVKQAPVCSKCKTQLPERLKIRIYRFVYLNPLLISGVGIGIIVAGYAFLDRYSPGMGLIWNAINGTVGGLPYRYFLTLGLGMVVLGIGIIGRKNQTRG